MLYFDECELISINDSYIEDPFDGFQIYDSDRVNITKNYIYDFGNRVMDITRTNNTFIYNNTILDTMYGIDIDDAINVSITENYIKNITSVTNEFRNIDFFWDYQLKLRTLKLERRVLIVIVK